MAPSGKNAIGRHTTERFIKNMAILLTAENLILSSAKDKSIGENMTTKIGLCGVHGAGKTAKAKELRDHYADLGNMVLIVDEVARSCPHTLGTIEGQEWIWAEQMKREKYAMTQDVDMIICDRTVMDNLMYYKDIIETTVGYADISNHHKLTQRWWDLYVEAVAWLPTYTQVIRMPLNLEWLQADDPIRPKDVKYARRIDALFDQFVQPYVTEEL